MQPARIITHHFLFQKRYWDNGWAKALRNHPYCGAYLNQAYLHRSIHESIHDVPVPNGAVCREVYQELCREEQSGLVRADDPPWIKLSWLIEHFEDSCPATVAILAWEKEKITKFYKNAPST